MKTETLGKLETETWKPKLCELTRSRATRFGRPPLGAMSRIVVYEETKGSATGPLISDPDYYEGYLLNDPPADFVRKGDHAQRVSGPSLPSTHHQRRPAALQSDVPIALVPPPPAPATGRHECILRDIPTSGGMACPVTRRFGSHVFAGGRCWWSLLNTPNAAPPFVNSPTPFGALPPRGPSAPSPPLPSVLSLYISPSFSRSLVLSKRMRVLDESGEMRASICLERPRY